MKLTLSTKRAPAPEQRKRNYKAEHMLRELRQLVRVLKEQQASLLVQIVNTEEKRQSTSTCTYASTDDPRGVERGQLSQLAVGVAALDMSISECRIQYFALLQALTEHLDTLVGPARRRP